MCKIPTKGLLVVNGVLWTAIGTKILVTGVASYMRLGAAGAAAAAAARYNR